MEYEVLRCNFVFVKKLIAILCVLLFTTCRDIENCGADDNRSFMVVKFLDINSKSSKKVGFVVTAKGSPNRFALSSDSTAVGLPLNPEDTVSTFFFNSDTSSHELQVSYDKVEVKLFDPKCQPSYTFIGLDTVRQTFDSTVVVGEVTNVQLKTNVEIYF